MHYGDDKQIEKQILQIAIYKHGTCKPNKFEYVISSIQKCEYFNPRTLGKILNKTNKCFKKLLKHLKEENWYLINITSDGYDFSIEKITNVSEHTNDFLKLH